MIKKEIKYTPSDVFEAQKLNYRYTKQRYFNVVFGAIFLLAPFFLRAPAHVYAVLVLCGAFLLTFSFVYLWFYSHYLIKKVDAFRSPTVIEFSDTGIKAVAKHGHGDMTWDGYHHMRKNDKVLLIYVDYRIFHLFPKRIFDEQEWNELISLVDTKIGNRNI